MLNPASWNRPKRHLIGTAAQSQTMQRREGRALETTTSTQSRKLTMPTSAARAWRGSGALSKENHTFLSNPQEQLGKEGEVDAQRQLLGPVYTAQIYWPNRGTMRWRSRVCIGRRPASSVLHRPSCPPHQLVRATPTCRAATVHTT